MKKFKIFYVIIIIICIIIICTKGFNWSVKINPRNWNLKINLEERS